MWNALFNIVSIFFAQRRIPEFASMFSDNPRYTVKVDPAVPQPAFTDLQWRGHTEQRKEALQQLAG